MGIGAGLVVAGAVRGVLTQALTWMNSASAAGSAAAGVLSGGVIDAVGARGGLAVAAGASTYLLLLCSPDCGGWGDAPSGCAL